MSRWSRLIKIFVKALRMTLRGEAIPTPEQKYPQLATWVTQGQALIRATFKACDAGGMDATARQALTLKLDHRDITMQTILSSVRHNLTLEYPMLMQAQIDHNITTLYALNLNDQFRVKQLHQALATRTDISDALKQALQQLDQHLHNIPPSNVL